MLYNLSIGYFAIFATATVLTYFEKHIWLPVPNPGPEVSLLLVGAAGNGRSALGNNIVGRNVFEARMSATMVTTEVQMMTTVIGSRNVTVVDTPGLSGDTMEGDDFDDSFVAFPGLSVSVESACNNLESAFELRPQGYHAFIIVMNMASRTSKEQLDVIKCLEICLGNDFFKYAIFVFTHEDLFEKDFHSSTAEVHRLFLDNQPDSMKRFFRRADNRILFVNSLETGRLANREFHIGLIYTIDTMKGSKYSKEDFNYAQGVLKNEIRQRSEEEEQKQRDREESIQRDCLESCEHAQELLKEQFQREREDEEEEHREREEAIRKSCSRSREEDYKFCMRLPGFEFLVNFAKSAFGSITSFLKWAFLG